MTQSDLIFEKAFLVTTTAMHLNRSHPSISRNIFWVFQFLIILTLSVTSFLFLVNSVLFFDIPTGRYIDASKNGTMAIIAFTINAKYAFLLYYQNYVTGLIETVNKDYEESENFDKEEREIIETYSKRGANVSKYWLFISGVTSIIFPLKAFYLMALSYMTGEFQLVPLFDMKYPYRLEILKEIPAMFCLLFSLCLMFGVYAATMYVGFDPLVPILLLHICGQLEVLSKRMTEIFNENFEEVNEKLKQINMKLQYLYRMTENIKSKFTIIYEYNMKTTTFLLPLSMFQVADDLRRQKVNFEFISFFAAHILHFYMPSYYSDALMEHSENLRKAIYSCGWEKHPDIRARKTILIMLTRTTAPLVLNTIFYPICLDTFAEMCRQSYAIFNIMNAAWA